MMRLRRIITAIGRVLGITPAAGHVAPTEDFQTGGERNTVERQCQPVSQELKAKRSRVKADIQAQSAKVETLRAQTRIKKSKAAGTPQVTPAPQPVQSKPNNKRSPAKQDTKDQLCSSGTLSVQAVPGVTGQLLAIPVKPSRQGQKSKHLAAPSTTVVLSPKQEPTTTKRKATPAGKRPATPAFKTRQPVTQVQTPKQKAAVSTTAVKKTTRSKTAVQTHMVSQSKVHGS